MNILKAMFVAVFMMYCFGVFDSGYTQTTIQHKVKPNETFWSIAEIYADQQDYPFGEFVYVIRDANGGIDKQTIYPGETLIIPLNKK